MNQAQVSDVKVKTSQSRVPGWEQIDMDLVASDRHGELIIAGRVAELSENNHGMTSDERIYHLEDVRRPS